jgi:hypothetical protein
MCKELPGPRCSNHAAKKKEREWKTLLETQQQFADSSIEVKKAQRAYQEAVEEYKATPDGLKELEQLSSSEHAKYEKQRELQVEALNEVRNGRFQHVAKLITAQQSFYDEEEVTTVLESVRRQEEQLTIKDSPNELTKEERKTAYQTFIHQQETQLSEGKVDKQTLSALQSLRTIPCPKEDTSLRVYAKALSLLPKSKEMLKREIQRIATMQDVSLKVAEAYHDAYRNEYQTKYAHLPKKEQPNPPSEWVNGEYSDTGFQSNPTTSLVPSDPATMYATYRLRSDPHAIPDYLKNSRIVATAHVDKENQEVSVLLYNNKGKEIERSTSSLSEPPYIIAEKLRGKIIVMDPDAASRNWLVGLNKAIPLNSSVLATSDIALKQLNVPDSSLSSLCQVTKTPYKQGSEGHAETVMKTYFRSKQQIAAKWQSKSPRKKAPVLENLPLTSRWA